MSSYQNSTTTYSPPTTVSGIGGGLNFPTVSSGFKPTSFGGQGRASSGATGASILNQMNRHHATNARAAAERYGSQVGSAAKASLGAYGQNLNKTLASQSQVPGISYTPSAPSWTQGKSNSQIAKQSGYRGSNPDVANLIAASTRVKPMHGTGGDKRGSWSKGRWMPTHQDRFYGSTWNSNPNNPVMADGSPGPIAKKSKIDTATEALNKARIARSLANADPVEFGKGLLRQGGHTLRNPSDRIAGPTHRMYGSGGVHAALGGEPHYAKPGGVLSNTLDATNQISPITGGAAILADKDNRTALSKLAGYIPKVGPKIEKGIEKGTGAVKKIVPESARKYIRGKIQDMRPPQGVPSVGEQGRTFPLRPEGDIVPYKAGEAGPKGYYLDKRYNTHFEDGDAYLVQPKKNWVWRPSTNPIRTPDRANSGLVSAGVDAGVALNEMEKKQGVVGRATGPVQDLRGLYNSNRDKYNSGLTKYNSDMKALKNSGLPENSRAYAERARDLKFEKARLKKEYNDAMNLYGKVQRGESAYSDMRNRASVADHNFSTSQGNARKALAMSSVPTASAGGKLADALRFGGSVASTLGQRAVAAGTDIAGRLLKGKRDYDERRKYFNPAQSVLDTGLSNISSAVSAANPGTALADATYSAGSLVHPTVGRAISTPPRLVGNVIQKYAVNPLTKSLQTGIGTRSVPPGFAKTGGFKAYGERVAPGGSSGYSKTPSKAASDAYANLSPHEQDIVTVMEDEGISYDEAVRRSRLDASMNRATSHGSMTADDRLALNTGYTKETLNGVSMWVPPGHSLREDPNAPPGSRFIEAVPNGTGSDWSVQGLRPHDTQQMVWAAQREKEAAAALADTRDYSGSKAVTDYNLHKPTSYGVGKHGGAIHPQTFKPVTATSAEIKAARPAPTPTTQGTIFQPKVGSGSGGLTNEDLLPKVTVGRPKPRFGKSNTKY